MLGLLHWASLRCTSGLGNQVYDFVNKKKKCWNDNSFQTPVCSQLLFFLSSSEPHNIMYHLVPQEPCRIPFPISCWTKLPISSAVLWIFKVVGIINLHIFLDQKMLLTLQNIILLSPTKEKTNSTASQQITLSPTKTFYPTLLNSAYHFNHVSYEKQISSF